MKKNITTFFLLFLSFALFAQNNNYSRNNRQEIQQKVQAEKVAFFTTYLDLSVQEAQAFWPLYNEYFKELEEAHSSATKALKACKKENLSESELSKIISEYGNAVEKEGSLTNKYIKEFKKILPLDKVAKIFYIENDFRLHLLSKLRGERKQQ